MKTSSEVSVTPFYILTPSDLIFMHAVGIDPEIPPVLQEIFDRDTGASC